MPKENGLFYGPTEDSFRFLQKGVPVEPASTLYEHAVDVLKSAQALSRESSIGVTEADWTPVVSDPDKPLAILLATDIHFGGIHTDYDLLGKHLDIVEDTPNFSMVTNGDDVDNFTVTGKWATGTYENPLPPQLQTKAMIERLQRIDKKDKLGAMSFGNHNNFLFSSGYDWLETFAQDMKASIFTSGGLLHIHYGNQDYDLAMTHKYWGNSKLNPTNSCKRFLEHEHPNADIVFLGHTHQSELLRFERAGKERIGVIGGTYKLEDSWARQNGIGGRAGHPGITVLLYPKEHKIVAFKNIEDAKTFMEGL